MALASKRYVERRIRESRGLEHPRRLAAAGPDFPWSKCSFGYKINPDGDNAAEVKIYDGQIITDNTAREPVVVTHIPFVISGTQTIYVQADVRNVAGTAELTVTPNENVYYRYYRLYEFTESGGVINNSLTKIYRPFDVESGFDYQDIPDGTEANPHLIWSSGEWAIGVIVPDGSVSYPHLVWTDGAWTADKLYTLKDGGTVYRLALWDPVESAWTEFEVGTTPYTYFGIDALGVPTMDYVRWA